MIASENDPGGVKTDARCDGLCESAEISGRHAGVTAFLIDLIAGRLDEDAPSGATAQSEGGLYRDRMGGADRSDARTAVSKPFAHQGRERPAHHETFLVRAARKASSSAWLAA